MIFFPRDICEKLQAMGCKSESGFYYGRRFNIIKNLTWDENPQLGNPIFKSGYIQSEYIDSIPAFSQNDFTGCHEQARENAKIVWPALEIEDAFSAQYHRYRMIDAPDAAKYLQETINAV